MDINQLTKGERFAIVTALDDREFQLSKDIERGAGADKAQLRRKQILADLASARLKLSPLFLEDNMLKGDGKVHFAKNVIIDTFWFLAYYNAPDTLLGQRQISIVGHWRDNYPPGMSSISEVDELPKFILRESDGRVINSADLQIVGENGVKSSRYENCKVINPKSTFEYGQYREPHPG